VKALESKKVTLMGPTLLHMSKEQYGMTMINRNGKFMRQHNLRLSVSECVFLYSALYCCVYGLGWPLAISWQIGFSGKGFHFLNIVEL